MKKAMNQSTLVKILNGVSIGALFLSLVALILYGYTNERVDTLNRERFELTYNANRFMNGSAYLTNEVRAYSATGDQVHYDNYFNEINVLKNRDIGVENMVAIGITDEERAMIDEMSGLSNQLVPLETQAMENAMAGDLQAAIDYVYGPEYESTIGQINALKNQFLETLDARAAGEVRSMILQADLMRTVMFIFLILVGVLQVVNLLTVKRQVLQPIITIRDQMGQISQGNLSADFPLEPDTSEIGMLVESIHSTKRELKKYIHDIDSTLSKMAKGNMDLTIGDDYLGEFRPIQDAMRQIVDSLNQALSQIDWAADQVSVGSGQVAASGQVLSDGAMNQAATVEELSASIQDLSDQVHLTTDDAKKAQTCSADASSQLELCNEKMANLMDAMENISNASKQIGGIIATIENIAFQTNILALNAAVEAARAGAAGKGFAVVADEVRNLATKSGEASKNTTALIENTLSLVRQGTELTADTTEAFHAVVSSAEQSTTLMGKIAQSAVQQATSIDQLNQGMQDISGVVQTNASTAEESAAAAQELSNQADMLKQSVRRFQLRKH